MPTKEQLAKRRAYLGDVIQSIKDKGDKITDKGLIEAMREHMPSYQRNMLYIDKLNIKSQDTFVSDLAIYTYSSTIRTMFEDLDEVKEKAKTLYNDDKGFVKINALKITLDTVLAKEKILSGKALDVSIELLGKKFRKLTDERNELEAKLNSKPSLKGHSEPG